jgi:tryptophan-rich sensory protein
MVWMIIYILMGTSTYLLWYENVTKSIKISTPFIAYMVNLLLNRVFGYLFYEHGWFNAAAVDTFFLWISTALSIYFFHPVSRLAAHLLLPYLGWVTVTLALTTYIAIYNPNGAPVPVR